MAFKNSKTNSVTDETVCYTPDLSVGTVIGLTVCPTSGNDTTVSVKVEDSFIVKDIVITAGSTLVPIGGEQKLVVLNSENIKVQATDTVDVIVSVLEQ